MKEEILDVSIEFGKQLLKYLKHFGLIEADLARLIKSNTDDIKEILEGKKGVVLKSAERISNVFGLRYFEFGNPKFKLPNIKDLPDQTRDLILNRKEKGVTQINRNYGIDLAGNLDKILNSTFLSTPHTAEEIWAQLPEEVRSKVEPRRVTDLLGKSPRNFMIEKIPPASGGGRKSRYVLKK
nr:hypothetical protein [Pedobacter panaciterrae]